MPPNRSSQSQIIKLFWSIYPVISNAIPVELHPIKKLLSNNTITDDINDSCMNVTKQIPLTQSQLYIYAITSSILVLLGGVFAGLTLGLMGQDEVYLKVISSSGTENEKKCSNKVLALLSRGKHWLLVTLLLSNVITNETLPVILDRLLGGGFAAVFSSTIAIVIFGEIIPQSICVRYGLELGAFFAPYVLILMYIMYPIAYPIAKLLDYLLGEDHGTFYRKNGLKSLVNLHHTMGTERLNLDEVTIINAVLDLKAKPVCDIMTPIEKVYTLPSDKILDEKTVEEIFNAGFSRIPIHFPGEHYNYVGMLLVRILISYDPEDELPISSFPLATLPETSLNTSCLNILNYFQEGKSHMVVVSESPGKDSGAIGVVTLEDVIEELIGEEIVDETDVYIDVNKNIKREIPGPLSKRNVTSYLHNLYKSTSKTSITSTETINSHNLNGQAYISKDNYNKSKSKSSFAKTLQGIKPSNLASDPLKTNNNHITIKKQPQLLTSLNNKPLTNIQKSFTNNSERSSLSPPPDMIPNYGGLETINNNKNDNNKNNSKHNKHNNDNDDDNHTIIDKNISVDDNDHQIHNSEASALIQGIYNNASRHTSRCDSPDDCHVGSPNDPNDPLKKVKKSFLNNTYGIPVPKQNNQLFNNIDHDNEPRSGSTGGILVEDNIVSVKGVNKTIIHDGTWRE